MSTRDGGAVAVAASRPRSRPWRWRWRLRAGPWSHARWWRRPWQEGGHQFFHGAQPGRWWPRRTLLPWRACSSQPRWQGAAPAAVRPTAAQQGRSQDNVVAYYCVYWACRLPKGLGCLLRCPEVKYTWGLGWWNGVG